MLSYDASYIGRTQLFRIIKQVRETTACIYKTIIGIAKDSWVTLYIGADNL